MPRGILCETTGRGRRPFDAESPARRGSGQEGKERESVDTMTIERAEELVDEGFSAHWLHGAGINVWAEDMSVKDGTIVAKDGRSFVIATVLTCTKKCGCTLPVE